MWDKLDTKDPNAVEQALQNIYTDIFPRIDPAFIARIFYWAIEYFHGCCPGYQAVDARYHDFEHTLQGTLCMGRLLHGRHRAGVTPVLTREMFELGVLAMLLHDTGYLKRASDVEGTGAKYTLTHVQRSTEFATQFLKSRGYKAQQIQAVRNMIRCTGVGVDLSSIPFQSELERRIGFALGTSDLLGQMAAEDYVDKLPILFAEFKEAAQFSLGPRDPRIDFASPQDLMSQTSIFWKDYVVPKITEDFQELYRFLEDAEGRNPYLERVQANLDRIQHQQSTPA